MPKQPEQLSWTPAVLTGDQFFGDPKYKDSWGPIADALGMTPEEAAQAYAGIPVVSGYNDKNGNWITSQQQFASQAPQIKSLQDFASPQGFSNWLVSQGITLTDTGQLQAKMGDIAAQLQAGPDVNAQQQYAANTLGFGSNAEYQGKLAGLLDNTQPLNPQQKAVFDRATEQQIQQMRTETLRAAEAIGIHSTGRALVAMDDLAQKISSTRLQAQVTYMNYDQSQRLAEYKALVDANQKSQGQYADQIYKNRMGALQAYATQFDSAMKQQSQYLNEYSTDYGLMVKHADVTYNAIMASIGYDKAQLEKANEEWSANLASYKAKMDAWVQQQDIQIQQEKLKQQEQSKGVGMFVGFVEFMGGAILTGLGLGAIGGPLMVGGANTMAGNA